MNTGNLSLWMLRGHVDYEEQLERALAATRRQISRYNDLVDRANETIAMANAMVLDLEAKLAKKELEVEKLQNRLKPFLPLEAEQQRVAREQQEKEEREAAERLAKEAREREEKAREEKERQAKEELLAALNTQMIALQQQIEQVKNN